MIAPPLPRGMHSDAVDRIASWIVQGRFAPGATLPTEPDLGAELGVSRSVVREAIRALQAKGMVVTRPRTGTRVLERGEWHLFDPAVVAWTLSGPIDADVVEDLVELRLALEPFAAGLAARRRNDVDIKAMRMAIEAMEAAIRAGHKDSYTEADLGFHRALLCAAHNLFVTQALQMVLGLLSLSFKLSTWTLEGARLSMPGHRAVHEAIVAGDGTAARRHLETLIIAARRDILEHIDAGDLRITERRLA